MGVKSLRGFLVLMLLVLPLAAQAAMDPQVERLARWQLNNADLLVDEGKYMQALEYIDSAYEMSQYPKTRKDALLARAMVQGTFLDAYGEAVKTYGKLAGEFPEYRETAAYQTAFLLLQAGDGEGAKKGFETYLTQFPQGRFRFQAEAMLKSMGAGVAVVPRTPKFLDAHPVMRVLLAKRASSVEIRPATSGQKLAVSGHSFDRLSVAASGGRLKLNGAATSGGDAEITCGGPVVVTMNGKSKKVRGVIYISNVRDRMQVVNRISIESYLRSVVPAESYASWPLETLKAQAIAARTYAYFQKLHRTSRAYDVRADTYDQMYGGVDREQSSTDRAVRETEGMILTYDGRPILAQYTANSGGHTADAGAVFNAPKPYLVAHPDPASLKGKMASWKRSFTGREIESALAKIGVKASGLTGITPEVRGPSGRLVKVRLHHSGGSTVLRTRTSLASSRVLGLPEVLFHVEKSGGKFVFRGHGHGHGVGYSQWGSAELGKTKPHDWILGFYYPGTTLARSWN